MHVRVVWKRGVRMIVVDGNAIDLRQELVVDFLHGGSGGERRGLRLRRSRRSQSRNEDKSNLNDSLHSTLPAFTKQTARVAGPAKSPAATFRSPHRATAARHPTDAPSMRP